MIDVRTMCLGLLLRGDASGYEIKKKLEEGPFCHFLEASFGSIYPALTRLAEYGLVDVRTEAQDGRPDKKIYAITAEGRAFFMGQLAQPPMEDKCRSEFLFYMMFGELLEPKQISNMIDAQIAHCREKIAIIHDYLREGRARSEGGELCKGPEFAAHYGLAISEAVIDYLEKNRHLIESGSSVTERELEKV